MAHLAAGRGIPVYAPDNVNHPLWVERIAQLSPRGFSLLIIADLICDEILQLAPQVHLISTVRCYQNMVVGAAELGAGTVETETGVTLHEW
ncbi:hypothetical protein ACNKHU_13775 [Shigella flexneri]